jgi:hypothetical protein
LSAPEAPLPNFLPLPNGRFYFPIVTCILVSILLSLIVSIFRR